MNEKNLVEQTAHIQLVLKDHLRDVAGEKVADSARKYLGIVTGHVKCAQVFSVRYALTAAEVENFAQRCLQDPVLHDVTINTFYCNPAYRAYILVAKLPGVTDDEGMSAQKTLADFSNIPIDTRTQHIFSKTVYYIEHALDNAALKAIAEELLGNPLIHHFEYGPLSSDAAPDLGYVPEVQISAHAHADTVNIFVSDAELLALSKTMVLSLNLEEMQAIRAYYGDPQVTARRRNIGLPDLPTDCEIEVLAQTWSEHCKHKEFNAMIQYDNTVTGERVTIDSLFDTYIRGATAVVRQALEARGEHWLIKVFADNAGVVKINDQSLFVWKVETHNSPSAIDPYGGAITGIVGNNRDPLGTGVGGARLLFNTNVLCFGSPFYAGTLLTGQLHPKRIFEGVRKGIEDGGNKSGIPTVNGAIIFDDRYRGKPLVYCGTGGVMPSHYTGRPAWEKRIDPGDRILMAGGRVGKDGIHGATFSSAEIDEHSPQSAVQIGSPITQKLLSDFMERACLAGLIACSTDNGAGGLSSSIGELAGISGGAVVRLERVPLKYSGLMPWEIFVSESQERMTFVVKPEHVSELCDMAAEMEVELSDIGNFTANGFLDVRYNDRTIAYLALDFLHDGVPRKTLAAQWTQPDLREPELPRELDYDDILLRLLGSLNICSRERVIRQYDHEVKGKTVIKPLMGPNCLAPQDAAVMRLDFDSYAGIAVSNGILPRYGDIDAYQMSAGAFDEAVRQILAVGGKLPLSAAPDDNLFWSVNDNFCVPDSVYDPVGNPDGKLKLAKLVQMCAALYDMATYFTIPLTSGKDSMKNDFKADGEKISVPPTVLYSMAAKIPDVRRTVTAEFKAAGDLVYVLGTTYDELGGSEFYALFGELGANVPNVRKADALALYRKLMQAHDRALLESCHDCSDGGLMVAAAEATFGTGLGIALQSAGFAGLALPAILFAESHSRFVASVRPENQAAFETLFGDDATFLGQVTAAARCVVSHNGTKVIDLAVDNLVKAWNAGLQL